MDMLYDIPSSSKTTTKLPKIKGNINLEYIKYGFMSKSLCLYALIHLKSCLLLYLYMYAFDRLFYPKQQGIHFISSFIPQELNQ